MTALLLGVRLALAPSARSRTAMLVLAAAIGTTIVLIALAGGHHAIATAQSYQAEMPRLAAIAVAAVGIPCAVLVVTVGRLSAALRDRRLANLRLVGLTPIQTRAVAAGETGVATAIGSVTGVLAFWALRPMLLGHGVATSTAWGAAFRPTVLETVASVAGLTGLVVLASALPTRGSGRDALALTRRADRKPPGLWRVIPLVIGLLMCLRFSRIGGDDITDYQAYLLFAGITLLGVGMLLVVPVLVRLITRVALRCPLSPSGLIAVRRLESQPAAVSRIISALLLGLFLVVGARFVLVAWESTPQYLSAAESLEAQQTAVATTTLRHQAQTERRLAALDGVSVSAGVPTLYSRGQAGVSALVLSCRDLAAIVPGVSGCRDDAPTWVQDWSEDFVHEVTPQATDLAWRGAPGLRTSIAAPTLRLPDRLADGGSPIGDMQGDLIIPPRLVGELSPGAQLQIVVHAPPGRDLPDRVASAAEGGSTSSADFSDYDFVTSMRALIWTLATVIISVGLLALAIAAVDRAVQRRREMIALRLLGVGASTLRRAQWWETALPVLVGTISAVALGAVGGATYLSFDDTVTALPWAATIRLGELALLGGAAVAVLAMVAVAPRIRPDDIRAE